MALHPSDRVALVATDDPYTRLRPVTAAPSPAFGRPPSPPSTSTGMTAAPSRSCPRPATTSASSPATTPGLTPIQHPQRQPHLPTRRAAQQPSCADRPTGHPAAPAPPPPARPPPPPRPEPPASPFTQATANPAHTRRRQRWAPPRSSPAPAL